MRRLSHLLGGDSRLCKYEVTGCIALAEVSVSELSYSGSTCFMTLTATGEPILGPPVAVMIPNSVPVWVNI